MIKNIGLLSVILLIMMVILSACSSGLSQIETQEAVQADGTTIANEMQLTIQTRLVLGTFSLEDTENKVTSEQAQELLPMWKTLKVLLESDSAADLEIEALEEQIQETMTSAQNQTMNALSFTRESYMEFMSEYLPDIQMGGAAMRQDGTGNTSGRQMQAGGMEAGGGGMPAGGGGMPAGGMPAGGGGMEGETGGALPQSDGQITNAGMAGGMNTLLIDALIELLESK
ncbi:MAG: hypothetical protein CVU39_09755 [Chloroflexi bacterium HGW-Chloroflexi-10]|nr:MAG: hypothetical protein CVU39_09755 [Chloroflexi bacterium HGW-Chloroflexi-10]